MASRTLKKNKRTKHGRTRRQRQRRRQMRGGEMKWLDIFKPTVKDAAYCQKQFDECNANIKPQSDSAESSSDFFKTPTFIKDIFGTKDSTASVDDKGGEFEMQELPVAAAPALVADETALADAAAADAAAADTAAADAAAADAAAADAANAAAADAAAADAANAAAADAAAADAANAAAANAAAAAAADADTTALNDDATTLNAVEAEKRAKFAADEAARINNSMGIVIGGSRKKYKKRNANRSKKNKNRRNKKRTNKRN
jgi:hypothetical protein